MKSQLKTVGAALASVGSSLAIAAADPAVTAGITTAGAAFTDNFTVVFGWFVGVSVVIMAGSMLIKYIRRAK